MILNNGHPFGDFKRKAIENQYYELAAYIRDVERTIISDVKYGQNIPAKYFQDLHKRLLNDYQNINKRVSGYNLYKSWMRRVKIQQIYVYSKG
jgi:hypothetical protein